MLRRLAKKGRAICLVVHQPLAEVLEAADLLWLVVDGRTAYFGPLDDSLRQHFQQLDYRDPSRCRFRNLSEALNFVTLKPATWDAISYNAAMALEFQDPKVCSRGVPERVWDLLGLETARKSSPTASWSAATAVSQQNPPGATDASGALPLPGTARRGGRGACARRSGWERGCRTGRC